MKPLQVGERVRFDRALLKKAGVLPSDPRWRLHGVVVGHIPPRYVRVRFDGEEAPRTIAAVNLVRPFL